VCTYVATHQQTESALGKHSEVLMLRICKHLCRVEKWGRYDRTGNFQIADAAMKCRNANMSAQVAKSEAF
jgi:hypothetical protein